MAGGLSDPERGGAIVNISEFTDSQVERSIQGAISGLPEYVIGIECDDVSKLLNYVADVPGTPRRYGSFLSAVAAAEALAHQHPEFRYYVRCVSVAGSRKQYLSPLTCPRCARGTSAFGLCPECQKESGVQS